MYFEVMESFGLILCMYISATAALYSKLYSFWNDVGYLVLLDYVNTNCSAYCLNY